jgi:hypothetical protein
MPKRPEDPIRTYQRKSVAERRMAGKSCTCGESRPEALIYGSEPTICNACGREQLGLRPFDEHHPAGSANNQVTVLTSANDHRNLSDAQYDWPEKTLRNPKCSPLLAHAANVRGYYETNTYLGDTLLLPNAPFLEELDEYLEQRLGPGWWVGTPLEKFAPKPKPKR